MKLTRSPALMAIVLGALLAATAETPAHAKAKAGQGSNVGLIEKSFQIPPKGLRWGLSLEGVAKLYDKQLEEEMLPLYRKAQPGLELEALNVDLKNKQGALRRSRVDFGTTPTGVDQSALKGEYTYNNGESMAWLTLRSGTKRYFFFFNDRLWKVYDEHKLKQGSNLGENFQEAVKVLATRFGAAPKLTTADYEKGRPFDEAEWRDPDKVIRALDRGNTLAVVYAERRIQENLSEHRRNKAHEGPQKLDSDVASVIRSQEPPPGAKDKDKDKDKDKGKAKK